MMRVLVLAAILACTCCGISSATQRYEDMPIMHMVLLQFTLDGDNPYEFASYASEFAEGLENIIARDSEFENVNAVVLGVGKTECGVSVVAVIEYTKNQTSVHVNAESLVQYMIELIEGNKDALQSIYSMKNVRSVDADKTNVRFVSHKSTVATTKIAVGVVVGTLALIGLAATVAGVVLYTLRVRGYEKVPLLADEQSSKRRWLKLPWNKKNPEAAGEAF